MTQTMQGYLNSSKRTQPEFPQGKQLTSEQMSVVYQVFVRAKMMEELADDLKKNIYYDTPKDFSDLKKLQESTVANLQCGMSSRQMDLLHAALGKLTEAVEFFEAIMPMTYGQELDKANLIEELGDDLWYSALAMRALDTTFEHCARVNIEKLYKRFPHKFDAKLAQTENRNLEEERDVLVMSGVEGKALLSTKTVKTVDERDRAISEWNAAGYTVRSSYKPGKGWVLSKYK